MENWYSKEFISSSQTAARLVFNINNCVDLSKVLQLRPNRPPDAKGRESFVYIMDGAVVRSIKDLPIDELTPWNSKKCKSSTRFSSVQFDTEKNSLVFNRYIISDAANVDRPECLIACYYCKHPIFNLVKKIYYACDSNRERCLPGTFVIFIYEFAHAEILYRTYGAYRISANNSMASSHNSHNQLHQHLSPSAISAPSHSHSHSSVVQQQQQSNTNSIQRYFENVKMEDFMLDDSGGVPTEDSYEFDTYLQGNSNASCLEDILEACNSASLKRTHETASFSNDSMAALLPQFKRVKRSNSEQPDPENETSPNGCVSSANESPTSHFRHFFTTEGLLENFQRNCLCDREELTHLLDILDDQFIVKEQKQCVKKEEHQQEQQIKNGEEISDGSSVLDGKEAILGGCLLVDSTFLVENLYITVLWFRNCTFLDSDDCPLIHPIAALISSRSQPDDQQFLINRLSSEISDVDSKGICRSVIFSSECDDSDLFSSITSPLFSYPCVRLISVDQIKQILHQKIVTFNEENLQSKVEDDLFRSEDGLLNASLSFEHFARKLRIMERGWPSGFRMWFREKSGWMYERCSLVARIRAGFTQSDVPFDMADALASLKETLRQNLSATLAEFSDTDSNLALKNAISTTEQMFTDLLVRAVHSVISNSESDRPLDAYSVRLHPAKAHFWVGSSHWAQFSAQERRECLSNLGLSALSAAGTLSANSFDPLIFSGLSRSHKMDLLSRANALDVLNLADNVQKKRFVVEDNVGQHAFYVCNESKSVRCQCQSNVTPTNFQLCEHILAIVLKDNSFARRVSEIISQNKGRTPSTTTMVNGIHLDRSSSSPNQMEGISADRPITPSPFSSPVVEIICCSSNGSNT